MCLSCSKRTKNKIKETLKNITNPKLLNDILWITLWIYYNSLSLVQSHHMTSGLLLWCVYGAFLLFAAWHMNCFMCMWLLECFCVSRGKKTTLYWTGIMCVWVYHEVSILSSSLHALGGKHEQYEREPPWYLGGRCSFALASSDVVLFIFEFGP